MKIAIAGAGQVGCSIATELAENGHSILVIDKDPNAQQGFAPGVEFLVGDACELAVLEKAKLQECQVVVAAMTRPTSSFPYSRRPNSVWRASWDESITQTTSGCSTNHGALISRFLPLAF